ncbi:hypothetical protein Pla175_15580 [Pirellulimonas nuda]|uniref:Uncharacterized protein n=1 Tax=Pirellulimonas nuda TaxID=2528009 RepID=A0A518D9T1_9BACT|nr:DUF6384 family protein [Pirellulimonas nuda]QDU88186.1 hypothetical protein Pla175_15580 [Pirellulimonas nuda]
MPAAQQTAPPPAAAELSVAEMTRIMDVAGTLRRERRIAEQQLSRDETKQMLRERLLEAARVSGDPVTEQEIDAAIAAYFENLHEFKPPEPGMETFAASVYVRRGPIAKWAVGIASAAVLWWALATSGVLPGTARNERIADDLLGQIQQSAAAVQEMAVVPDVQARVDSFVKSAEAFRESGRPEDMRSVLASIASLESTLKQEYTLRIVQQPRSGVERNFEDESGKRVSGQYVIVQALDSAGRPLPMEIRDAETGQLKTVTTWGEQVPEAVFERIAADKQADGVLDEAVFASKERGKTDVEVQMSGAEGAPVARGRQITQW